MNEGDLNNGGAYKLLIKLKFNRAPGLVPTGIYAQLVALLKRRGAVSSTELLVLTWQRWKLESCLRGSVTAVF